MTDSARLLEVANCDLKQKTLPALYPLRVHGTWSRDALIGAAEKRAVQMSILIIRAFVNIREALATPIDLARAPENIGRRQERQGEEIAAIIETINQLLLPEPVSPHRHVGFNPEDDE